MKKRNKAKDILTISGLAPYVTAQLLWLSVCVFLIKIEAMHIFTIYWIALVPSSILTSIILWQYTKSRQDSIGIILFNWIGVLIIVNGIIFYILAEINFEIRF